MAGQGKGRGLNDNLGAEHGNHNAHCAKQGGNAPAVMSAANEAAVGLFLNGKLGYNEIYESVEYALGRIGFIAEPSLEDILSSDGEARTLVKERYS